MANDHRDVSTGDLAWRLDQIQQQMLREFAKVEERISRLEFVSRGEYLANREAARDAHKGLAERVEGVEDWQTWALRLVLGVVMVAVLALVVTTV